MKINYKTKSLDVVKLNHVGTRTQIEYQYEWKHINKLFIPSKTLSFVKKLINKPNHNGESPEPLPFSIDVNKKGRIDFLAYNAY